MSWNYTKQFKIRVRVDCERKWYTLKFYGYCTFDYDSLAGISHVTHSYHLLYFIAQYLVLRKSCNTFKYFQLSRMYEWVNGAHGSSVSFFYIFTMSPMIRNGELLVTHYFWHRYVTCNIFNELSILIIFIVPLYSAL